MKAYGGVDVRFTPGTHCIGDWVDPRAGVDNVEKRKFLTLPRLELRPLGRPAHSNVDDDDDDDNSFLSLFFRDLKIRFRNEAIVDTCSLKRLL
jgi:hypothetical protein